MHPPDVQLEPSRNAEVAPTLLKELSYIMKGVKMKLIDQIFHGFHLFMVSAAKVMLLAMVIITGIQVFSRYVLGFSIRWSEEVPLILMVWFGFISMSIGVKKKLHISIELFFKMFPEPVQKVVYKVVDLLMMGFGLVMTYYGFNLARLTMGSTMPATKLPSGVLYGIIAVAGIMITYDTLMDLVGYKKLDHEPSDWEVSDHV